MGKEATISGENPAHVQNIQWKLLIEHSDHTFYFPMALGQLNTP